MKNGFSNVTIQQIQDESGFTAGSIYYHFEDKDEILCYMVEKYLIDSLQNIKDKVASFEGTFIEKLELIVNHTSSPAIAEKESIASSKKFTFKFREFWSMYSSIHHHHPEMRPKFEKLCNELHDFYYDLIQESIGKKEIRDDIDIEELIMFIQTMLKGHLVLIVFRPNLKPDTLFKSNLKLLGMLLENNKNSENFSNLTSNSTFENVKTSQ